jgi:cobalt-zinc-cadmium efflux system outer membrane protein
MRFLLLFLVALATVPPVLGQALTLDEARRRALEAQPALKALELGARSADEASVADGSLPDPRLKLGALNFPTRNFPSARDDMTQVGVSWEQMFPGGDKRRLRTERTRAEAEQARAEAAGTRQAIVRDVGQAWVDTWAAIRAEGLVAEIGREYGNSLELSNIAVASGRGLQADVFTARQFVSQANDRRLELVAQARRARAMLARWIPDAAARDLPAELPQFTVPAPLSALADALEHHPQHSMHLRAQSVAEADVALAREASKPDRSVELGYYARSGDRSDMLMFQVAIELPLFADRKQDRMVASKLAQLDRVREQRADHLRQLRAELAAAYADWDLASERLRNAQTAILPDARARLDAVLAQHSAGAAPLSAVFDARRNLVEARAQELSLYATQAKARIALQYFEHEEGSR